MMDVNSVERDSPNWQEMTAEDAVTGALRDLARWQIMPRATPLQEGRQSSRRTSPRSDIW
jgi:hypothetical protein